MFDVWVMLTAGVFSYYLQKKGFPVPPLILGFVLAPLFEMKVRQSLEISNCDLTVFLSHPISLFFLLLAFVLITTPAVLNLMKKVKERRAT